MDRPTFSEMLFERRRELGYSIGQASRVLRLKEEVLVAFEEGDFDQMPKSGYAQGMISSYARYLGLDANVVVEAYARDLEAWKRELRRHGKGSAKRSGDRSSQRGAQAPGTTQPYVGQRGLLPTSGGLAGDMGSFSTTRVRTRMGEPADETPASAYGQGRPYTNRSAARMPSQHGYGSRTRGDIETMHLEGYEYEDDLQPIPSSSARQYESASSGTGRRSSRNISNSERPRVQRQSNRQRGRSSSRDQRQQGPRRAIPLGPNLLPLALVIIVLLISVVLIFSVSSCMRDDSGAKTVPVSAASSPASASAGQDAPRQTGADATDQAHAGSETASAATTQTQGTSNTGDAAATDSASKTKAGDTSVSVSVSDGAVSWLEVECDGRSDVAETITGPWQRTYTVSDSITIQAGDTTAVSVVQDGRQVQFDSMASGIGTVRIQGTGKSSQGNAANASATGSAGSSGSGSTSTSTSTSASNSGSGSSGSSARMGNASAASSAESGNASLSSESDNDGSDQSHYSDSSQSQESQSSDSYGYQDGWESY